MKKTRYRILQYICENPGISLLELSNEVEVTKSVVSIYLKDFEKDGLILKYPSTGRRIKIHPTAKAIKKYTKIKLLNICEI